MSTHEKDDVVAALREALLAILRETRASRFWGGMGWSYHPLPGFRTRRIEKLCREAVDSIPVMGPKE